MARSLPDPPSSIFTPSTLSTSSTSTFILSTTPSSPFHIPLALPTLPKQQLQGISGHSPVGIPTSVLDWCHCDLMVVLSQAVQGQTKKIFFSSSRTKYKKVSYLYLEIYSQLCPLHTDIFSMVDININLSSYSDSQSAGLWCFSYSETFSKWILPDSHPFSSGTSCLLSRSSTMIDHSLKYHQHMKVGTLSTSFAKN